MDSGLENVVAAETALSDVDGARGRLIICGMPVERLARTASFEAAAALLWRAAFDAPDESALAMQLSQARQEAFALLDAIPANADPITALRIGWSLLPDEDTRAAAIALAGSAAVFVAAAARRSAGLAAMAPQPSLRHGEDFLAMLHCRAPSAAEAAALNAYLVTVCDHGLNASTFAARVVASTRAGLASACIAGLSALKGPLHGGAPGLVLDMLDAIGDPEAAEDWIAAALARGERLMGFGHRVYRVRDPRADALKHALSWLPAAHGRIAFAEQIEREALERLRRRHPERALETNVEFYTAILLEALAIPRPAFTAVFAMGRTLGWIAHAREQIAEGRLVRPKSIYRGPLPAA